MQYFDIVGAAKKKNNNQLFEVVEYGVGPWIDFGLLDTQMIDLT